MVFIQTNVIQAGITVSIGTNFDLLRKLQIIGGSDGKPLANGIVALPRDPTDTVKGGYEDVQFTFLRTPLSVMQDVLCKPYLSDPEKLAANCGVRVQKNKDTGRYEPVFVLSVRTWWDGMYHSTWGGMRGLFNPYWVEITNPALCQHIQPWNATVEGWNFPTETWGRIKGTVGYPAPPPANWEDWTNPPLRAEAIYGDGTPFGPHGDASPGTGANAARSCLSEFPDMTAVGSPLWWTGGTAKEETLIPVVQVQAGGQ